MKRKTRNTNPFMGIYQRFTHAHNGMWHECFYCGDPADTVDHCPPISRVPDYRALGLQREYYVTVSCCGSCNSVLANTLQDTLQDRVTYLKDRLEAKHKTDLDTPEWWDEDVEELGPMMQGYVAAAQRRRERTRKRLDYFEGETAWLLYIGSLKDEAA